MEFSDIQKGLSAFVSRYDSQTYLGSYRETERSSLLKEGLSTRANSLWKMAEYVVAKYDNENEPIEKYLSGWVSLASKVNNQFLLLEVEHNTWKMYNAKGEELGGEDYIRAFFEKKRKILQTHSSTMYRPFITAIKTKPFLLLAGISGTGKSRIVRELARACWEVGSEEYEAQKPRNFEMVQVKPNWHDSTELLGYVSRVSGTPEFIPGDFLRFIVRAWEEPDVPYFLCLDEMNLAPVEQYFAEYLSVIESRKVHADGKLETDPIIKNVGEQWFIDLTLKTTEGDLHKWSLTNGFSLPQNLIVIGTVNMDETTYSFSRKVLDRAMTIEMNEFDIRGGLERENTAIDLHLNKDDLIGTAVEGKDVYSDNKEVCEIALNYLSKVNEVLKDTPFAVAYRTRNEFLLYVVNNLPYNKDEEGNDLPEGFVIARALDEITSMKMLSRIEGDDTKVSEKLLSNLHDAIDSGLKEISSDGPEVKSISLAKIDEMKRRLLSSGYTSYWS